MITRFIKLYILVISVLLVLQLAVLGYAHLKRKAVETERPVEENWRRIETRGIEI